MSIIGARSHIATILDTASLSDAVELDGFSVIRIIMPAGWDAADLTFQVSDDEGDNFYNLYWDWGPEVVVDAGVSRVIELSPFVQLTHIDQIKVRSGTAGVPVAQNGTVEVILVVSTKD